MFICLISDWRPNYLCGVQRKGNTLVVKVDSALIRSVTASNFNKTNNKE